MEAMPRRHGQTRHESTQSVQQHRRPHQAGSEERERFYASVSNRFGSAIRSVPTSARCLIVEPAEPHILQARQARVVSLHVGFPVIDVLGDAVVRSRERALNAWLLISAPFSIEMRRDYA